MRTPKSMCNSLRHEAQKLSRRPTTRWDELMTVRRFVFHKEPNLKDIEFSILKHQGDDEKTGAADDRHPTAPGRRKSRSAEGIREADATVLWKFSHTILTMM